MSKTVKKFAFPP